MHQIVDNDRGMNHAENCYGVEGSAEEPVGKLEELELNMDMDMEEDQNKKIEGGLGCGDILKGGDDSLKDLNGRL